MLLATIVVLVSIESITNQPITERECISAHNCLRVCITNSNLCFAKETILLSSSPDRVLPDQQWPTASSCLCVSVLQQANKQETTLVFGQRTAILYGSHCTAIAHKKILAKTQTQGKTDTLWMSPMVVTMTNDDTATHTDVSDGHRRDSRRGANKQNNVQC